MKSTLPFPSRFESRDPGQGLLGRRLGLEHRSPVLSHSGHGRSQGPEP